MPLARCLPFNSRCLRILPESPRPAADPASYSVALGKKVISTQGNAKTIEGNTQKLH